MKWKSKINLKKVGAYKSSQINKALKTRVFITLGLSLFGMSVLIGQDATKTTCKTTKTFVIRKKNVDKLLPNPNEEAAVAVPQEKKIATDLTPTPSSNNVFRKIKKTTSNKAQVAKFPTLAGGEFGLMDVRPFQEKMDLEGYQYVILQYFVNEYGWAASVEVLKSNDKHLEALVLEKLKASKWNPAIDVAGQAIAYQMYPQVVIVKDRTYEEDYTDDE